MKLTYILMALMLASMAGAFTITTPESTTYYTSNIMFKVVHNETLDTISYVLDDSPEIDACIDCYDFNTTLNLSDGQHVLTAYGHVNGVILNDSVAFEMKTSNAEDTNINTLNAINASNEQDLFKINVKSPLPRTYYDTEVKVDIASNITLDSLNIELGKMKWMCVDCSSINDTMNLSTGDYTLIVRGILDDVTKNLTINFKVRDRINITANRNITRNLAYNGTRDVKSINSTYGKGFEKLPKILDEGNITDIGLANIIRTNKLDPGILNRIIKTGKLGNASITAILDTQFRPQGIFGKLFGWLGFKQNTYASLIAENYNLSASIKQKIVKRDDLPKNIRDKINSEIVAANNRTRTPIVLTNRTAGAVGNNRLPSNTANRTAGSVGNNRLPLYMVNRTNNASNNRIIPPGQVK